MMADINGARYNQALYGGYNANLLRMGKSGLKIQDINRAKRLNSKLVHNIIKVEDVVDSFQKGGKPKFENWYKTVPVEKNDTTNYDLEKAYNELPFEELEAFRTIPEKHLDGRFKKPNHMTYSDEGYGWIGSDKVGWTFYPSPRQQKLYPYEKYVEYWNQNEPNSILNYNGKIYKVSPKAFKEGGSMNVIPEGSLHARLHHMDNADNLTKKGIPVVDNDGNQQAEIELNEIIFRKEVTDKLEKLAKDGSDEAAIEAGKLLVEEILNNTDDRTGLIDTIEIAKNGTKLTPKLQSGNILTPSQSHLDSLQNIVTDINSKNFQNFLDKNNKLKAMQSIGNSVIDAFSNLSEASEQRKTAKQLQENQLNGQLQWYKWMEQLKLMANADVAAQEEQDNRDRAQLYELRSQV